MPYEYAISAAESEIVGDQVVTTSKCGDQLFIGKMPRSAFRSWVSRAVRMLDAADREQSRVRPFCGECERSASG